jgi:hypothetical protein
VEAARVLHVPRVVEAVREQRRRHRDVLKLCQVRASQVRILAKRLGVRLPSASREQVPGAPKDVSVRNVCHVLGTAMSMLFKGERNYAYPVRVAGSGVAGLAFFMSDGTVIKVTDLHLPGRRRLDRGGLVPGRGASIPEHEFLHELRMTRLARSRFAGSKLFAVPHVPRAVILRGPKGARVGVMQQTVAAGTTMAAFLRDTAHHPQALRLAAAKAHGRAVGALHAAGWVHGDPHTENVFVRAGAGARGPRVTIIDWGRANTRRQIRRHAKSPQAGEALWAKFLRYESAFPYRDMATHGPGRPAADAYLEGYMEGSSALKGKGPVAEGIVNPAALRADYHGLVQNNVGAMFQALEMVGRNAGKPKSK